MQKNVINKIYIDGEFVTPHGTELADLFNPATGQVIGQVQYADEVELHEALLAASHRLILATAIINIWVDPPPGWRPATSESNVRILAAF